MLVEETCVYSVSEDNPNWTVCKKTACVTSPVRIGHIIERFGVERFKANSDKARRAVNYVLDSIRPTVSFMEGRDPAANPDTTPSSAGSSQP
mmetsp:Transcript_30357/g.79666  ORF Transcript_30357/g.79666 Transcript_30357/m.79666 type:complete len:92 (+) Transcript_30357:64-339(+)